MPASPTMLAAGHADVVEEDGELGLGLHQFGLDRRHRQPGGVRRHDEHRHRGVLAGGRIGVAADHEDRVGLVGAGGPVLGAVDQVVVAVAAGGHGQLVGVGTGVGLGDREGHGLRAGGEPRQPLLLELVRPVLGDDRAADRRGDDQHQQRAATCGDLLEGDHGLGQARAAAAVLLGQVHAEEARCAEFLVELGGLLVCLGAVEEVGEPVLVDDLTHRQAQRVELGGGGQQITHRTIFEPRRSTFQECAHRLDDVGRGTKGDHAVAFGVERVGHPAAGAEQLAELGVGPGRSGRDLFGELGGPRGHLLGRHDLGNHPEVQCLGSGEYAVEVTHLRRHPTADEAGEEPGVAAVGPEREGTGADRELRAVTGDHEVRDVQQTERAATGGAVHCRHDRHGQVGEDAQGLVIVRQHHVEEGGQLLLRRRGQRREVTAGGERRPVGGDQQCPQAAGRRDSLRRSQQILSQRQIDGVAGLRARQPEVSDRSAQIE